MDNEQDDYLTTLKHFYLQNCGLGCLKERVEGACITNLPLIIYNYTPQSEETYTVPVQPDLSKITRDVINELT